MLGWLDFEIILFYSILIDVMDGLLFNMMRFIINVIDENESVLKFFNDGIVYNVIFFIFFGYIFMMLN